jgi:hypothetical protein
VAWRVVNVLAESAKYAMQSMETTLRLDILPQPDDLTCGPTCLQAIYRFYDDDLPLSRVIAETPRLPDGGTLAVLLACHALRRGYAATIYTYNLQLFDPTWFAAAGVDIRQRLTAQAACKGDRKLRLATAAYMEFLEHGGSLRFEDLTPGLIRHYLRHSRPILTGLSATYLYRSAREFGPDDDYDYDDIRGHPVGHFVVLCGYDSATRHVLVADPLLPNPVATTHQYAVSIDRVICAILLGILTYDANLLIIEAPSKSGRKRRADPYRGQ